MLPSAEPLMKQASAGSTARALTGESWAWKLWRCSLWVRSSTLIQPRRPPANSSCCLGEMASTVAPVSWQLKAGPQERRGEERRDRKKKIFKKTVRPCDYKG